VQAGHWSSTRFFESGISGMNTTTNHSVVSYEESSTLRPQWRQVPGRWSGFLRWM
jgi:hypothetical protein